MSFSLIRRLYNILYPPSSAKLPTALKFGILGAAAIGPSALVSPAKSHPDVVLHGVAARDRKRAEEYAKKFGFAKVYGSYQELLDDAEIDVVYNPLPNGLHYEWTMKALAAGKHVLLEKPATSTAEECRIMFEYAETKGLVLVEAFHYRWHPAIQRVKEILDSGELSAIKSVETSLSVPSNTLLKDNDIRLIYELGGGVTMDMGCYTLSCLRYLAGTDPLNVISASSSPHKSSPNVDYTTHASFSFPNSVSGSIACSFGTPWVLGGLVPSMPQVYAEVKCEGGSVKIFNFVVPTMYHYIQVTKKEERGESKTRVEKVYTFPSGAPGQDWWTTYRFQLEAFVDKVRGREPQTWVTKEDSIANMHWIEQVYEKNGMGVRPASTFKLGG